MRQYIDTLQDLNGNALVGASVLVQNYIGGLNASIFSDNGLTPIGTSTVTTGVDGQFSFFAADGDYNLVMSKNATVFKTQSPVSLFDGTPQLTFADTGAVNAYAIANSALEKALRAGLRASFKAANSNTGASTFQYNGLAVKPIIIPGSGALPSAIVLAGGIYTIEYDGTSWQIKNPNISAGYSGLIQTAAEIAAGVTPTNYAYPELNILRYGALSTNTGAQNAAAIQQAVSVLAQHTDGELLIPAGFVFPVTKVTFTSMTQFNIRCDGVLSSSAASLGSFVDLHGSAGTYTPLAFTTCTRFKLYGKGYINPGFVDALIFTSCSDFDIALDCRGTGQNSVMRGVFIQECFRFRVHDMTIDSITGINVQGALTTTAVVNAGATTATATTWPGGAGSFGVVFTEVAGGAQEIRNVTFGAGTSNVSMTWTGGITNNCTATFYAEIYYPWLDNLALFSCYEFKVDHIVSKSAGGNGIYVLSVGDGLINYCHDFDICDNLVEFNSESGIQLTWAGGTQCPINYRCNNNTLKNNQADGIDAANTGPFAIISAQFNNNLHISNGFINFNPANPGGNDGSGIGTFQNIGEFEAIGNTVSNCNNAGIYLSGCTQWRIANNIVGKVNGNAQGGVYITGCASGSLRDCDVSVPTSIPSLSLLGNGNNIIIDGCNFGGGAVSLSSGTYTGSKISRCQIVGTGSINGVMDMIDNNITLTGAAPVGIVCSAPNLHFVRNTINCPGPAINTNSSSYMDIEDNIIVVTAVQGGILITGSNGCVVSGNNLAVTSAPAIFFSGTCDHNVVSGNKISGSGNSVSYGASTLNSAFGNKDLTVGGVSLGTATFQVNFPL